MQIIQQLLLRYLLISIPINFFVTDVYAQRGYILSDGPKQWQYQNIGDQGPLDIDIDLTDAWKLTAGGHTITNDEIVIAIIDGGVNLKHPDLKENIWINRDEISDNGIDDDNNGFIDDIHGWNFSTDSNDVTNNDSGSWHGTPINGIIGADGNNTTGVSGINKSIKLLNLVRGQDTSSVFSAYKYVLNMRRIYNETNGEEGAFIVAINHSWGKDSVFAQDNEAWCELFDDLGAAGVLTVVAVPNYDVDIDRYGDMPSTCPSDFIITVTNTNHYDHKIVEAGFGRLSVDIGAPGEYSYTTLNNFNYGYFGGTSAAAPYITGTIGLLYSIPSYRLMNDVKYQPSVAARKIKEFILTGSVPVNDLSDRTFTGGRLNVFNSMVELCTYYQEHDLLETLESTSSFISVYPNPAHDVSIINVELDEPTSISIRIYDYRGRMAGEYDYQELPDGNQAFYLDLKGFRSGVYLVKVILNDKIDHFKLVKN